MLTKRQRHRCGVHRVPQTFSVQPSGTGRPDRRRAPDVSGKVGRAVRSGPTRQARPIPSAAVFTELIPDELVWNNLKTHGTRRNLITSPE